MPPKETEYGRWFVEQIQPHERMLRAWLSNRYPPECSVDDIVQETYLRALKARERGALYAPKAFLFTTARNLAIDYTRRLKTSRSQPLAESEVSNVTDESETIPEAVAREQEYAILSKAIASLPKKCRKIFTMRRVDGISQMEIAQKLGISRNTVSAQLTIGLRKCSEFFEQYREENGL